MQRRGFSLINLKCRNYGGLNLDEFEIFWGYLYGGLSIEHRERFRVYRDVVDKYVGASVWTRRCEKEVVKKTLWARHWKKDVERKRCEKDVVRKTSWKRHFEEDVVRKTLWEKYFFRMAYFNPQIFMLKTVWLRLGALHLWCLCLNIELHFTNN